MIETRLTVGVGCKASSCIHKMAAPTHNPIRISNTMCGECLIRAREGTGTLGVSIELLNVDININWRWAFPRQSLVLCLSSLQTVLLLDVRRDDMGSLIPRNNMP